MKGRITRGAVAPLAVATAMMVIAFAPARLDAQRGRGGRGAPAGPPPPARAAAALDVTGYWVSLIVDEWRFRVVPQKGDIPYLPLKPEARQIANNWDPDKDKADGNACKAYGAVGVMQRPGRLHITWQDDNTLKLDADAGTQTRILHFDQAAAPPSGEPTWQGFSKAVWEVNGRPMLDTGGTGFVPINRVQGATGGGQMRVTTTRMKPGYIRKNGVPYSDKAVLTEYFAVLTGQQNDSYLTVTAMVDDPTYLTQPFVRTYTFKKQADATGWEPTPCWPK